MFCRAENNIPSREIFREGGLFQKKGSCFSRARGVKILQRKQKYPFYKQSFFTLKHLINKHKEYLIRENSDNSTGMNNKHTKKYVNKRTWWHFNLHFV